MLVVYCSVDDFLAEFEENSYNMYDVTDDIKIGEAPTFLLNHLKHYWSIYGKNNSHIGFFRSCS